MITRVSQKTTDIINSLLWKLGSHRRKKILKFFGNAEEIQKEINHEIMSRIKK